MATRKLKRSLIKVKIKLLSRDRKRKRKLISKKVGRDGISHTVVRSGNEQREIKRERNDKYWKKCVRRFGASDQNESSGECSVALNLSRVLCAFFYFILLPFLIKSLIYSHRPEMFTSPTLYFIFAVSCQMRSPEIRSKSPLKLQMTLSMVCKAFAISRVALFTSIKSHRLICAVNGSFFFFKFVETNWEIAFCFKVNECGWWTHFAVRVVWTNQLFSIEIKWAFFFLPWFIVLFKCEVISAQEWNMKREYIFLCKKFELCASR